MNKETYTIEEIKEWASHAQKESAGIVAGSDFSRSIEDEQDGIAAWKARKKAKDEDAEWLREKADAWQESGPNYMRLINIADRLEALQKRVAELEYLYGKSKPNKDFTDVPESDFGNMPEVHGWIPHKAGPMPCKPNEKIQFLCRDNYEADGIAEDCNWGELGKYTITHWRPAK